MLYFYLGGFRMEEKLEDYYKEYKIIDALIKQELNNKDVIYNKLIKTKVGKLYLSLTEEQRKDFRDVYSDSDITRYYFAETNIEKYNQDKTILFLGVAGSDCFPLNKESFLNLYVKNGVDTYNALTNESTKDLDISDGIKKFIQEIIGYIYGFSDELSIDDIPLIKVIYDKLTKSKEDFPKTNSVTAVQEIILDKVKRIHAIDKNHITYKENRRNVIVDLKEKIDENETEIRNSDSGFKYLLLSLVETAKYEVSLLEGKRVTALLKEIEESSMSESDKDYFKDALVKAYYNLTNIEFRKQSKYFDNDNDICYATFETGNPEINKRLIKMRQGL